ncbi:serine protease [Micromonospora sp. 4G57]|uniref:Serine protease n=1 Tax=Micromonospora sicca TaxID=2202420 RepID=A0ABU5JPX4_9ACTN|nr:MULTISPECIES: serine protease [unclassified Micromonospora]MDZ5447920.1 serine protease [Micromonospora sp. 4G57]MDZ5494668.1 serine protease [Micromonospora sp. 4G53]
MWPTQASLYIEPVSPGGEPLSGATGFVVTRADGTDFLLTARHVLTGRHDETKQIMHSSGATPEKVRIYHYGALMTVPEVITQDLYDDDGDQVFIEDPSMVDVETADVVALPLSRPRYGAIVRSYELPPTAEPPSVTAPVWIVGYPAGSRRDGHELAVWSRGSVATDPVSTWHGDRFLVDSRTRPGQSGAPVISFVSAHSSFSPDGQVRHDFADSWTLLGLYSGRLYNGNKESSDLGSVWTVSAIRRILYGVDI